MADQTVEEYRAAQAAEYGQYTAKSAIEINGVRAFNPGDPVPTSHVTRQLVPLDRVEQITTTTTLKG